MAEESNAVAIPGSSSHADEHYTYAGESSVYGITSQLDQFNLGSSTRGPSVISTRDPYRSDEPLHPGKVKVRSLLCHTSNEVQNTRFTTVRSLELEGYGDISYREHVTDR